MRGFLHRHRAALLLGALLVAGGLIGQEAAARNEGPLSGLSSRDSEPGGALALATWLEGLGYTVTRNDESEALGDLLLVLQPSRGLDLREVKSILDWVQDGGVLLYVPGFAQVLQPQTQGVPDAFGQELQIGLKIGPLAQDGAASPLFFTSPPAAHLGVMTAVQVDPSNDAWVPLIESTGGEYMFAAARPWGAGWVYVASSAALLSNENIGTGSNSAFILNLLARHAPHKTVAFDEQHHALAAPPRLIDAVRAQPWGWALGYAALISVLFVLWGGRRFGPPVVPERAPLRSPGEYVVAFAGLLQRARASAWSQQQYRGLFRRRLARRLGASPEMEAAALARLYAERHGLDPEPLVQELNALEGPSMGERQLLARVRALEVGLSRGS